MAKKNIVARMYIGGTPVGKVTYETDTDIRDGKRLARLVLDEFADFTCTMSDGKSWAITYTDGEDEFAFSSAGNPYDVDVEINGEKIDTLENVYSAQRTESMWSWLREKGWY